MMEKKMTKKEMFALVIEVVNGAEVAQKEEMLNFLAHEVELLERKSSKSTTTKTQAENEKIMVLVAEGLAEMGKPVTITELMAGSEKVAGLSNQKLSALLRIMKERGEVVKITEKKKSFFSLAE